VSSGSWTRRDLLGSLLRRTSPEAAEQSTATRASQDDRGPAFASGNGTASPSPELPRVIAWLQEPESLRSVRQSDRTGRIPIHRPPGALAETEFLARCTRCERCIQACPPRAIRAAPARFREAAATPWIDAASQPCRMCEDTPCITACEPGALMLDGAGAMGTARVLELDCLNRLGTSCTTCIEHCPVPGAIAQAGSLPVIDPRLCSGCGICLHVCPAPGKAIALLPAQERHAPGRSEGR
jgi:ferredoxin-type protein NapG